MAASASDCHPFPIYNARYRIIFPLLDADGDLVTGATTPDSELSQDCGTFADATNEMTEIATSSGVYYLDLTAGELDTKSTAIIAKSATAGMKTTVAVLYPVRLPVIRTGTAQAGGASSITLDSSASAITDYYVGCYVNITNNSPANAQGQARRITAYNGSTKVATVEGTYGTNPSSASTFEVLATQEWAWRLADVQSWLGTAAATPTVAGVPEVDVTHFNGTAGTFASGRPEVNTSHIAGSAVSTTTAQIGVNVVNAGGTAWGSGAITAAAIAADAITAAKVAADVSAEIADAVWDEATSGHLGAGTTGNALVDAADPPDPWVTPLPGAYGAGTAGHTLGNLVLASGTSDSGSTTTMVDAARTEADDDYWNGAIILFTSGNIAGQARVITDFVAATDTVTFAPATTQAVSTQNYVIIPAGDFLRPTTSGRTLDVSAGGEAGVDWANVGTPGSTVNLSATTVKTATDVETDTADIQTRLPAALVGGRIDANMGAISTDATAADNAEAFFDGTGYAGTGNVIPTVTNLTNAPTNGDLTATMKASVNAEVVDCLTTDTYAEVGGVVAATSSLKDKINWLFALARNKITQTSTTQTLRNDADSGNVATSTHSDDGTTHTRGEWT